jgi:hypothetical protein
MKNKPIRSARKGKFEIAPGWVISTRSNHYREIAGLPPRKKSAKQPTDKQLAVQMKWRIASQLASRFNEFLQLTRWLYKKQPWEYSNVVKSILANAITGSYPNFEIDYAQILLSHGALACLWGFKPSFTERGRLKIELYICRNPDMAEHTDRLFLALYNPDTKINYWFDQRFGWLDTEVYIDFPAYQSGIQYHLWIVPASTRGPMVGNSNYFKI